MIKHLDLFSGIGGFALAVDWTTEAEHIFCEIDPYCQKILKKHWPNSHQFGDIRDLIWLLDKNEGSSIMEVCEMINKESPTLKICKKQSKHAESQKSKGFAENVEKKQQSRHRNQRGEGVNFAQINVGTNINEETKEQTQMADNGCGVKETQTGRMAKDTIEQFATESQKMHNGEGEFLRETVTPAKIAEYIQRKKANSMPTILKNGLNIQNYDLNSLTESPYAKNVTKRDTNIHLLTAGVPCQPASNAGKRRGTKDDRWLWGETFRVIQLTKPTWVILENVRGLLTLEQGMAFEEICITMENLGYEVQPIVIPACAVNAPHRRDRVWIVAHSNGDGKKKGRGGDSDGQRGKAFVLPENERRQSETVSSAGCGDLSDGAWATPNPHSERLEGRTENPTERQRIECEKQFERFCNYNDWQGLPQPGISRGDDGLPQRLDRTKALGNAIVPQVAYEIIKLILDSKKGADFNPRPLFTPLS